MSLKDIQKLAIEGIAKLPFETLRKAIKTFLNTIVVAPENTRFIIERFYSAY